MKFMMTVKDVIEYINKGDFGIFNISYKVLDVQKIKYGQHLACNDPIYLEARRVPRFCKTKNSSIYIEETGQVKVLPLA